MTVAYQHEAFADCGAVTLCYDCFGHKDDPPVVLIMGLATQLVHWHPVFCQMLAEQGFRVIRFDNRDIGKSTILHQLPKPSIAALAARRLIRRPFQAPYSLDDMASDVIGLLDYLNISQAHIIGASMGGMIAQILALNNPQRVNTLTAIMSSTGEAGLMRPQLKTLMTVLKPAAKTQSEHVRQALSMWRVLHGEHFDFPEAHFKDLIIQAWERGISTAGILRQLAAISCAPDRTERLASLSLPSLVIHGDADPLLPVGNGLALAKAIPGCQLHVIKGMGHTLPQEVWDDVIGSIVALLRSSE